MLYSTITPISVYGYLKEQWLPDLIIYINYFIVSLRGRRLLALGGSMEKDPEIKKLKERNANLESQLDHLESELSYLNNLLLQVGFPDGVKGLKGSLEEVLRFEDNSNS